MIRSTPLISERENTLFQQGVSYIAGVDEAGRGCLAGPVVAAAVILPQHHEIVQLNDSKKLSPHLREILFKTIKEKATTIGIGVINQSYIDTHNILQATFAAMRKALDKLTVTPDFVLVDGNQPIPGITHPQRTIVGGDGIAACIAAASIIAKVTRDNIMQKMHEQFPIYEFKSHKGYGTKVHLELIHRHGLSRLHRRSFNITHQMKLFS